MKNKHKSRGSITAEAGMVVYVIVLMCLLFVWLCSAQVQNAKIQNSINAAATTIGGAAVFEGADGQTATAFLQFSGHADAVDDAVVERVLQASEREAVKHLVADAQERWYCTVALFDQTRSSNDRQVLLERVVQAEVFALHGDTLDRAEWMLGKKLETLDFSSSVIEDGAVWVTVRYDLFGVSLFEDWNCTLEKRSVGTVW